MSKKRTFLTQQFLFKVTEKIIHFVAYFLSKLPRKVHLFIGNTIGDFVYYCLPKLRKKACRNIGNFFDSEDKTLTRRSFHHLGNIVVEMLLLPYFKSTLSHWVKINGLEKLKPQNEDKPIILLTGHYGNWEMLSFLSDEFKNLSILYRSQKNKTIDQLICNLRGKGRVDLIEKTGSIKRTIQCLKNKETLAFAGDHGKNYQYDFFGRQTWFPHGAAKLAKKTGAKLFFLSCTRNQGFLEIEIENEIVLENNENAINIATAAFVKILEIKVIKNPEQFFWLRKFEH